MIRNIGLIPILGAALLLPLQNATASVQYCEEPHCGSSGTRVKSQAAYKRATPAFQNKALAAKELGGETLQSRLDGQLDVVTGVLTFPWISPAGVDLELVAMSLPATATGADNYEVSGWHRELFFLDVGDSVPRLLSAFLVDPEFVPEAQDQVAASGQLWISQYMIYQEAAELAGDPDFYAGFGAGGAVADLRFVTDDAGNVLEMVVDIYDGAGDYQYSVPPQVGDRYNPSFTGYDLNEPDIFYALFYFEDLIEFSDALSIQRRHFVPNASIDPQLTEGFDSGPIRLSFFLEGIRDKGDEREFSYGEVDSFGYTWAEAKAVQAPGGGGSSGAPGLPMLVLLLGLGWARYRAQMSRPR